MAVHNRHTTGYTLIELIAVLAIVSSLLVVAIPLFRTQVQNSQMSAAATDLLSTLMQAKAEAIGRRNPVTVCIRNEDADDCADTGKWEEGWLSFVDLNADGSVDEGEEIILIHPPLADRMTVRGETQIANGITYRPNGRTDLTATRKLVICDDRTKEDNARVLIVSILGKASIIRAADLNEVDCLTT